MKLEMRQLVEKMNGPNPTHREDLIPSQVRSNHEIIPSLHRLQMIDSNLKREISHLSAHHIQDHGPSNKLNLTNVQNSPPMKNSAAKISLSHLHISGSEDPFQKLRKGSSLISSSEFPLPNPRMYILSPEMVHPECCRLGLNNLFPLHSSKIII